MYAATPADADSSTFIAIGRDESMAVQSGTMTTVFSPYARGRATMSQ